jgi:hypothetical protein
LGYTNYYKVPVILDVKKFKKLSVELETIAGLLPSYKETILICGWDGTGHPVFTNDDIRFNGEEKNGMDCETFSISQDNTKEANARGSKNELVLDYCKTNRNPYDLMVKISMLRLKHHFPKCEISSDGNISDWKQAKEIYKKAFGGRMPKIN